MVCCEHKQLYYIWFRTVHLSMVLMRAKQNRVRKISLSLLIAGKWAFSDSRIRWRLNQFT